MIQAGQPRSEVTEIGYQQITVGKFIFRVREGYLYTEAGVWIAWDPAAGAARIGLSDFRQQTSGDVAFVELPAVGRAIRAGDEIATVETVKVDLELPAPFDAVVTAVNEALIGAPEWINRDPYGAGWLVELNPDAWPAPGLIDARAYLALMTAQAEEAGQ
jgi:glycine cleavage system H protein